MEYLLCHLIEYISQEMHDVYYVDEDYGQLEGLADLGREDYPIAFPAIFVDATKVDWSDCSQGRQQGTAEVRVRLALDCYDDTHSGSGVVDKIKDRDNIRQRLHGLLHGHKVEEHGALMRTTSLFYTVVHGIKVYEAVYAISVHEAPLKEREYLQTPLQVSLAFEGDK